MGRSLAICAGGGVAGLMVWASARGDSPIPDPVVTSKAAKSQGRRVNSDTFRIFSLDEIESDGIDAPTLKLSFQSVEGSPGWSPVRPPVSAPPGI